MAKMFINDSTLTAIADAIRAKTETTESMLPSEMAALITAISTGFDLPETFCTEIEVVTVTSTGTLVVPCGLSGEPVGCVILHTGGTYKSNTLNHYVLYDGYRTTSSSSDASWNTTNANLGYSNGTITPDMSYAGLYFTSGAEYTCIMWR